MRSRDLVAGLLLSAAALLSVGCADDGKYTGSGAVTVKGRPVPAGEIRFTPDTAKGNDGPLVLARIKDGRYEQYYEKWFGPSGTVPYPMSKEAATLMKLQAWP